VGPSCCRPPTLLLLLLLLLLRTPAQSARTPDVASVDARGELYDRK